MTEKNQGRKIVEEREIPQDELYLVVGDNDESQLALDFVHRHGLNPSIVLGKGRAFPRGYDISEVSFFNGNLYANSFGERSPPLLVVQRLGEHSETLGYHSFSGVRTYLRRKILDELRESEELSVRDFFYWRNVDTFYPSSRFDEKTHKHTNEELKLVTCFDKQRGRIFEGSINRAPHKLEESLSRHDYTHWHDVSSWEIGGLDELQELRDERGVIIKLQTRTVLFPDDVEILRNKKLVITGDSRSTMHVTYEAYFNNKGTIFGIYAHMFD